MITRTVYISQICGQCWVPASTGVEPQVVWPLLLRTLCKPRPAMLASLPLPAAPLPGDHTRHYRVRVALKSPQIENSWFYQKNIADRLTIHSTHKSCGESLLVLCWLLVIPRLQVATRCFWWWLELETKVHEFFVITENTPHSFSEWGFEVLK